MTLKRCELCILKLVHYWSALENLFIRSLWLSSLHRSLSFWFIALACGDRYLCSSISTNTRAWSSARVAVRAIPLAILIAVLVYIPIPIFYNIYITPATQKPACYSQEPYRTFLSYFNLIGFGLAPPLCMIVFNMFTLRHINQAKRLRVIPTTNLENTNNQNARKTDRQMLRMLLVQVLVYSLTGLTFSIAQIIIVANASQPKNVVQVAQENLINAFVGILTNTGPCLSFYLFTLSSGLFRKELKNLFIRFNIRWNQPQDDRHHVSNKHFTRIEITRKSWQQFDRIVFSVCS